MRVHLGRHFKFVDLSLDPRGKLAMRGNRNPIFDVDIGRFIRLIEENYSKAKTEKVGRIRFVKVNVLDKNETLLFKAIFPKDRGFYGYIIFIDVDKKLLVPIKVKVYGWNNELLEIYYFSNLKVNVGLDEKDFDIENPEYGF